LLDHNIPLQSACLEESGLLLRLSSSVIDARCYEAGAFFRTSQIGSHSTQRTAFMCQGQGVFKYSPSKHEESITVLLSVTVQKT